MTRLRLEDLTVDELVDRFAEIGIAQDEALLYDEHKKFNRLFRQMNEVDQELRKRGSEARLALTRLFDHSTMQVRLEAAKWRLGAAPAKARNVIENQEITMVSSIGGSPYDAVQSGGRKVQAGLRLTIPMGSQIASARKGIDAH